MNNSSYLKQVMILFFGVTFTPVIFLMVIMSTQGFATDIETDFDHPLIYADIIIATILLIASNFIYRFRIPSLRQLESTQMKLDKWKVLFILRMSMVETACMLTIFCLWYTGYNLFLYLSVALIFSQVFNFPARQRIASDLNLNEEETSKM